MVVTGASSGIGQALALASARAGYDLAIVARRAERLAEVAERIRGSGAKCVSVVGDVTAPGLPARIVESAVRAFGRIDAVVNNAGGGAYGALLDQDDAALEAQWQLHVAAPLRLTRAALAYLATARGQIVFIGSGVARVPLPYYGAYSLAKSAVRATAIQLRRELRPRGIAVTYVDPGIVATEFHSSIGITPTMPIRVSAERVARAILRGLKRRSAVVNVVPWQTAFSAMGEWSGTLADPMIVKLFTAQRTSCHPERSDTERAQRVEVERSRRTEDEAHQDAFEKALEPVARRMERVKLPHSFLREALVPGATLELGHLAMRWAGMPNKNERAALREALDALEAAGYLERIEEETWRVVRAVD
jgi:short-subunit dehydrogenase